MRKLERIIGMNWEYEYNYLKPSLVPTELTLKISDKLGKNLLERCCLAEYSKLAG